MDESEIYKRLGELVHRHRERMGKSQADLGKDIGLSRASVANIETGRQRIPLHHLYRLARALRVEAHTLLPELVGGTPPAAAPRKIKSTLDLSESEQAEVARVVGALEVATKRGDG
jgi:transcriptional regulator with XRE-family HTH domain